MSRLRRRCERRLQGLTIPRPFDLDVFCAVIATHRGRPLILQPVPGLSAGAPCGLWIAVPTADYVCYDPDTSRLHAEHIVLHELGHMLSGHRTGIDGSAVSSAGGFAGGASTGGGIDVGGGALARLVPDVDPRTVERILGRVKYTTAQEQEAEMLASLIRARAVPPSGTARPGGALGRAADALNFPS